MAKTAVTCAHCSAVSIKENAAVNRALKGGKKLFCGRKCFALSRRQNKSDEQRKAEKAEYDRRYREKNREVLRAKKAAYFRKTYDPTEAAIYRKARMHKHVEYCRRPEYREKKKAYDRRRRAKLQFGDYDEAFLMLQDLEREVLSRQSRYEIDLQNGKLNKSQIRKREYVRQTNGS